uniref:Transmembrane protein n=1 Tax=Eunotia naegelii TaxID=1458866 RepID=A0A2U9GHZ9_9STRA|nr:hypothetical protein [Eunotia naegelii]AWQ64110.1 hypothetical protein [Eunotia naegelii]
MKNLKNYSKNFDIKSTIGSKQPDRIMTTLYCFVLNSFRWQKAIVLSVLGNHIIYYATPANLTYAWSFSSLAGVSLVIQIMFLCFFDNSTVTHYYYYITKFFSLQLTCVFNTSVVGLSFIEFFLLFTAVTIIIYCSSISLNKKYNIALFQFPLIVLLYLNELTITINIKHFYFLSDSFGFLFKIITMIASLFCMYLLQDYNTIEYKVNSTEYDLLMLCGILSLTMLIKLINDFGTIFLALELQSLSLYMLSKFKKNSIYSIESRLKYFILGALFTAYFLLGWSLFYSISGLFVLLGFHFFLIFFLTLTAKLKKTFYNIKQATSINTIINNELIENNLIPLNNNLFVNITNDFDEIGILLFFNYNFKIVLKLVEFLCCESSNNNSLSSDSKNEFVTTQIDHSKSVTPERPRMFATSSVGRSFFKDFLIRMFERGTDEYINRRDFNSTSVKSEAQKILEECLQKANDQASFIQRFKDSNPQHPTVVDKPNIANEYLFTETKRCREDYYNAKKQMGDGSL